MSREVMELVLEGKHKTTTLVIGEGTCAGEATRELEHGGSCAQKYKGLS